MKANKARKPNKKSSSKLPAAALCALLVIGGFAGASSQHAENAETSASTPSTSTQSKDTTAKDSSSASKPVEDATTPKTTSEKAEEKKQSLPKEEKTSVNYKAHSWSYKKYPLYYKVWGKAKTSSISSGVIKTSTLDSLGRTRSVTAKVTYQMVADSAGWREDMTDVTCSGWGNQKIVRVELSNGRTYSGYGWNRSHLLADSLGGHAVRENVVCGTRTQNVGNNSASEPGGMAYTETLARDYLNSHTNGWVYYKASPVYKGSELLPRSVYVDIKSDDDSINAHVEVFNAMNGYKIDYETGELTEVGEDSGSSSTTAASTSNSSSKTEYVYVTKTGKKYHHKGCRYLTKTATKETLSAAESSGFTACSVCF